MAAPIEQNGGSSSSNVNGTGRLSGVRVARGAFADLHTHTTASDGRYTPEQLALAAHEAGLSVLALGDHDRIDNVLPLQREAARYGIHVVPAVEVSCMWGDTLYHMLVYNVDVSGGRLVEQLNSVRDQYAAICAAGLEELEKKGMPIDPAVLKLCHQGQPIAPYHIFQAIIKHEYAPNMKEAHELAKTVGVDFLPWPDMHDMIDAARESGAYPVLAHPGRAEPGFKPPDEQTLRDMIAAGLMGFEVWHPYHTAYDVAYYLKLCEDEGLLMTAGSDTHAPNDQRRKLTRWPIRYSERLLSLCGVTLD
jgi:predicted metal-dependent phosphoesterase TrpH